MGRQPTCPNKSVSRQQQRRRTSIQAPKKNRGPGDLPRSRAVQNIGIAATKPRETNLSQPVRRRLSFPYSHSADEQRNVSAESTNCSQGYFEGSTIARHFFVSAGSA